MKTKDFVEWVRNGAKPVVVMNKEISEIDSADPGMMARVVGVGSIDDWGDGTSTIELFIDYSEFEIHNKSVAIPNWSGDDGEFNQTWFESGNYPKDGKDTLHSMLMDKGEDAELSYCDVKEENYYFKQYLENKNNYSSYIDYLEKRLFLLEIEHNFNSRE